MKNKLTMAQWTLAGLADGLRHEFITPNIHQPWIRIETWSRLGQMGALAPVLMESYSRSLQEDSEDEAPHRMSGLIEAFVVRRMLKSVLPDLAILYERHCLDVVDRVWFNGDESTRQLYLPFLLSGQYSAEYISDVVDEPSKEQEIQSNASVPNRFVIANSMIRDLGGALPERSVNDNCDLIAMRKQALVAADRLGLEQFAVLLDSLRDNQLEVISHQLSQQILDS